MLMDEELDFLQNTPYNFHMHDSKIRSVQDDYFYGNIEEFFSEKFSGMARLIFVDGTGDNLDQIGSYARDRELTILEDVQDLNILRNLTPRHVVVVTKKHLMRGYDYRCETGIVLLIAKKVDSKKALLQALGRVGRYGSTCARMVDSAYESVVGGPVDVVAGKVSILNSIRDIRRRIANTNGTSINDFFATKE